MPMSEYEVDAMVRKALDPCNFQVREPLALTFHAPNDEEVHWEMFHGRSLDHTMTRHRQRFRAWNVSIAEADEPLLSIKWDRANQELHVTRAVHCYVHAIQQTGSNVVESAESTRWVRELVGTIPAAADSLPELAILLFQAVVGSSRLPLTSAEAPHPLFSLGQLGYIPPGDDPEITAKRLELALRRGQVDTPAPDVLAQLKRVFHGVSLSPYTSFVANALSSLRRWQEQEIITLQQQLGFLGYLLRLQWRHLNAYDLVTFHHRGVNYPDALLIEEVLAEVLRIADERPELFADVLVRRGLRLGWLLRMMYAGQPAPELPTSPGDNQRVLPAPFVRVPDEQLLRVQQRPRKLFAQALIMSANTKMLVQQCISELANPAELRELGTALILDRPLGIAKAKFEPDRTPMLAHIVHSRKLAERSYQLAMAQAQHDMATLPTVDFSQVPIDGVPLPKLQHPAKPGVVSIQDAFQSADDFHLVSTTRGSIQRFRDCFDWSGLPVATQTDDHWWRLVPDEDRQGPAIRVYSREGAHWLTLQVRLSDGYRLRRGVEVPTAGLLGTHHADRGQMLVFPVK